MLGSTGFQQETGHVSCLLPDSGSRRQFQHDHRCRLLHSRMPECQSKLDCYSVACEGLPFLEGFLESSAGSEYNCQVINWAVSLLLLAFLWLTSVSVPSEGRQVVEMRLFQWWALYSSNYPAKRALSTLVTSYLLADNGNLAVQEIF